MQRYAARWLHSFAPGGGITVQPALSWKLANFARLDPALKSRNIAGAGHGAKLEEEIWREFNDDWEKLTFESEELTINLVGSPTDLFPEGKARNAIVRVRVNQGFFRAAVLAAYDCKCCITGLSAPDLLAARFIAWKGLEGAFDKPFDFIDVAPIPFEQSYGYQVARIFAGSGRRGVQFVRDQWTTEREMMEAATILGGGVPGG